MPFTKGEAEGKGISSDIKKGFVYKRVPHVMLGSIANNPDIKEGMTRQQIDATIARHADTETLYHQPYEDNKRVWVSGPFSVESLSPHRVLSTADPSTSSVQAQDGTVTEKEARKQQDHHHDPGQPQEGGRAKHPQERTAHLRPARPLRRGVVARGG